MKKGFTLVEILAVVVLLLVVMLFTTPVLKKLINNGDEKERALIEERILIAAKEYASSYDNGFYDKLVKVGDYNYVYKTDLLKSGLIELDDLDKLDRLVGVKGELLVDDKVKYTLSYIDNNINSNDYSNEELYTMLQALTNRVTNVEQNGGGGGSSSGEESGGGDPLNSYPVGSIYLSINDTNPGTIFGGTWVSFGSGKTLVGVDTNDSAFNTVEKTGGEKMHTLTVAEIPSHTHGSRSLTGTVRFRDITAADHNFVAGSSGIFGTSISEVWSGEHTAAAGTTATDPHWNTISIDATHTHDSVGGGTAHNNLQPYITVYMWKRTA